MAGADTGRCGSRGPGRTRRLPIAHPMGTDSDTTYLRHRLRQVAARVTGNKRLRACGVVAREHAKPDGSPLATKTCDLAWECAWCAETTFYPRRADIKWSLNAAREVGSQTLFVTVIVSHVLNDNMENTTRLLEVAYDILLQRGGRAVALRRALDIWLIDRTLQTSWGNQGFHPHYHLLVFLRRDAETVSPEVFERRLTVAWKRAVEDAARELGRDAFQPDRGVDVEPVTDIDYLAWYLTKPPVAPKGPTGMFIALAKVAEHGNGDCFCDQCRAWVARWREYVTAMTDRRVRYATSGGMVAALEKAGATPKRRTKVRSRKTDRKQ